MAEATVTSKGQVTIPKPVRDGLQLETGDRLSFSVRDDGTVEMHLVTGDLRELRAMFKARRRVTLDSMDSAIIKGATDA